MGLRGCWVGRRDCVVIGTMTLRTEQIYDERICTDLAAGSMMGAAVPIRFRDAGTRPSLGERIVAAARVASAMHLTGAALISADEAAILALGTDERGL